MGRYPRGFWIHRTIEAGADLLRLLEPAQVMAAEAAELRHELLALAQDRRHGHERLGGVAHLAGGLHHLAVEHGPLPVDALPQALADVGLKFLSQLVGRMPLENRESRPL